MPRHHTHRLQVPQRFSKTYRFLPLNALARSFGLALPNAIVTTRRDGKKIKFGCSKDPNRNTVLLKVSGKALFFNGKMGVDADGSPLSKKTPGLTDQPETSFRYPSAGHPSVDSDKVPFIVIPGGGFAQSLGVKLGDIAAVIHKDQIVFALVADQGPVCKIGEGSIELHERLKHNVCLARNAANECTKLRDAGIDRDVLYFIFPGSNAKI